MIHNEMSFLFGDVPTPGTAPAGGPSEKVANNMRGNTGDIYGYVDTTKYDRVFKNNTYKGTNGGGVIGYLQDVVYNPNRTGSDSYISLLNYFNGLGGNSNSAPSMILQAADFVYLKDLGVYPINRLIILRRYRDGVIVPANLSLFKERPISTVVGWAKDGENELFSINFNEKWVEQTDTLDKVIQKIMKEQFGIKTENFMPIPGWSQGFLFGFLNRMGLTDYTSTTVPTGDPNVLRTSLMRDVESQSLLSDLKITFETSYEQKYIDGVDPGLAFQDILANLIRMGTSEMKFIIRNDSPAFQKLYQNVLSGGAGTSVSNWIALGKDLVKAFMDAIKDFFEGTVNTMGESWKAANDEVSKRNADANKDNDSKEARLKIIEQRIKDTEKWKNNPPDDSGRKTYEYWVRQREELLNPNTKVTSKQGFLGGVDLNTKFAEFSGVFTDAVQTILAGSVYRYRWPLIGSIGLMSGLATTPWHLTIGNPFSPILNMNNIVVNNVDLKFSNEMGFNDMPKRVTATIDIKMARPLGAQEINRIFNNQYGRIYSKASGTSGVSGTSGTNTNTNTNPPPGYHYEEGVLISNTLITNTPNVIGQRTQPAGTKTVGFGSNAISVNTNP